MSRSTISTFKLFELFLDQETARVYLETRLWPNGPRCPSARLPCSACAMIPDRPVGRLLEPRAPAPPEPEPYCDFCGRTTCRGDCTEKRQAVAGYARALAEDIDADPVVGLADEEAS